MRLKYPEHLCARVISYEEYHPYGTTAYFAKNKAIKASAKRYRYSGKERDEENGFYYYGARYYAAWLGRWISADPAGIVDGFNLYVFVLNTPVRNRDSDGRQTEGAEIVHEIVENLYEKSKALYKEGEKYYTGTTLGNFVDQGMKEHLRDIFGDDLSFNILIDDTSRHNLDAAIDNLPGDIEFGPHGTINGPVGTKLAKARTQALKDNKILIVLDPAHDYKDVLNASAADQKDANKILERVKKAKLNTFDFLRKTIQEGKLKFKHRDAENIAGLFEAGPSRAKAHGISNIDPPPGTKRFGRLIPILGFAAGLLSAKDAWAKGNSFQAALMLGGSFFEPLDWLEMAISAIDFANGREIIYRETIINGVRARVPVAYRDQLTREEIKEHERGPRW